MTRLSAPAALILVLAVAALFQGGPMSPRADAAACAAVHVRGEGTATHIRTHNVSCRGARAKLMRWLKTRFPRDQLHWYCAMSRPRKLCSGGNGMGAPYFTFRLSYYVNIDTASFPDGAVRGQLSRMLYDND